MAEDSLYTPKYSLPYPSTSSDVKPASEDFKGLALSVEANLSESEVRATQKVGDLDEEVTARGYVNGADPRVMQQSSDPDYVWAVVDRDGYAALAIRHDGKVIAPSLTAGNVDWTIELSRRVASDMAAMVRSDQTHFACIGDSLSYRPAGQGYPDQLRALLAPAATADTHGRSGYTADEILMQSGAIPLTVEVPGGSILASGDTPVQVPDAAGLGWMPLGATRTVPGTLAGVEGMLVRTDSNTEMVFRRDADGTAVPVSSAVLEPWRASDADHSIIALMGRNDVSNGITGQESSVPEHILAAYIRLEGHMSSDIRQFLALSVTNRMSEPTGTARYNTVQATNALLRERYGPRFLDIRTRLVQDGLATAGLTPTPEDVAAMEADTIPPQLMTDDTHWNEIGAGLVAGWVHDYLTTRDWIAT